MVCIRDTVGGAESGLRKQQLKFVVQILQEVSRSETNKRGS